MKDQAIDLTEQAATLESLLPGVMRSLFKLDPGHPASDLPVAQLRICSILQAGAASMSALSKELRISVSAMTQMADRLEATGLAERCLDAGDRRSRSLRLTKYGDELMRSRRDSRRKQLAEALSRLPGEKREALITLLQELLESSRSVIVDGVDEEGGRFEL